MVAPDAQHAIFERAGRIDLLSQLRVTVLPLLRVLGLPLILRSGRGGSSLAVACGEEHT
jgi:hypothetical protein